MTTKLIKLHEVKRITSLSRSTIYQAITDGRFPKPLKTGARGVAWLEQEVIDWITACPRSGGAPSSSSRMRPRTTRL